MTASFRDRSIAATLKPGVNIAKLIGAMNIPRSIDRGHIEAPAGLAADASRRGYIEGALLPIQIGLCTRSNADDVALDDESV